MGSGSRKLRAGVWELGYGDMGSVVWDPRVGELGVWSRGSGVGGSGLWLGIGGLGSGGLGIKDPKIARGGGGCRFMQIAVAKQCSSGGARCILAPVSGSRLRGPKAVFSREGSTSLGPEVVGLHQFLTPTRQNTR